MQSHFMYKFMNSEQEVSCDSILILVIQSLSQDNAEREVAQKVLSRWEKIDYLSRNMEAIDFYKCLISMIYDTSEYFTTEDKFKLLLCLKGSITRNIEAMNYRC